MYKFKVKNLNKKDKELKKLMKRCTKCNELKFIYQFSKRNNMSDGYRKQCRKCSMNYSKHFKNICVICGKEFTDYKDIKTCSIECFAKLQSIYSSGENNWKYNGGIETFCDYCGKEIHKNISEYNAHKNHFCSKECAYIFRKKQRDFICEICGKEFTDCRDRRFCSAECANIGNSKENNWRWNSNKTDEEREQDRKNLQYEQWRKQVFERDNYTCQCCGQYGGNLNAHHLNGYNWDKEHRIDILNGIALCKNCHNELHSIYGMGNNTIEQFREFLYNKYLLTKDIKYLVALEDTDVRKYAMKLNDKRA